MKVAYINTVFGVKSTGRTYAELKDYLEKSGNDCKVFYGVGKASEPGTYLIGSRFTYYFHNLMSRITGLEGYFSYFATQRLVKQLKEYDPDIIHLGSVHGHYINLRVLYKYLSGSQKPVFMTTHDCWSFTGKCTQFTSMECEKWKTQCHNCPAKRLYPVSYFFDFSRKMYNDKKKWLTEIQNLNVIAVSEWIGEQVKQSFLKNKNIYTNYNWINTDIFKPVEARKREAVRKELGVEKDDFIILAVSALWNRGTPRYEDISKLMKKLKNNEKLLVVGSIRDAFEENEHVKYLPFVSDVTHLAELYGSADAFVHFSIEDSFGKVIAEAQACGVPAIVYDSTACPEIALLGDGYVAPSRDVDFVYKKLCEISVLSEDERKKQREKRAEKVTQSISKDVRVATLIALYEDTLK